MSVGRAVGRYRVFHEFASGGMASLHLGRLAGERGFSRLVAIKRLHPQFAKDPEFVAMFMEEARLAARIHHPNVAGVVDVVREGDDLLLVMEYIHGESLSKLIRQLRADRSVVPAPIACAVVAQVLHGLHAAHEAVDDDGKPLAIVHRDVSPQNVLVGLDGVARIVDFGIAKALGRAQHTAEGQLKGKLGYFSPEQLKQQVDRRTDVFAAGIVLWEALRAERLFTGDTHWEIAQSVMSREIPDPSRSDPAIPAEVGKVTLRALERDPAARYATAREMARALEAAMRAATTSEVAEWVERLAGAELERRRARIATSEELGDVAPPPSRRASVEPVTEAATPKALGATPPSVRSAAMEPPRAALASAPLAPVAPPASVARAAAAVAAVVLGLGGVAFGAWTLAEARYARPPEVQITSASAAQVVAERPPEPPTPSASTPVATPPEVSASASATARAVASGRVPAVAKACGWDGECGPYEECRAGRCRCANETCNGRCTRLARDPSNCGACGHACAPNARCWQGTCRECDTSRGMAWCDSACVDLRNNPSHCGRCGNACPARSLPDGRMSVTCSNGTCLQ